MSLVANDLELAAVYGEGVARDYHDAVEFMDTLPDFSLKRFRDIVEGLCQFVAAQHNYKFFRSGLDDRIYELKKNGFVSKDLCDHLHEVRKLGNKGAHRPSFVFEAGGKESATEAKKAVIDEFEILRNSANTARNRLLQAFELVYIRLNNLDQKPVYELVELKKRQHLENIGAAFTTSDARPKYLAGLYCEAQAEKFLRDNPSLISTPAEVDQYKFLYKQAAHFYEAADKLGKYPDALYRYARVIDIGFLVDGENGFFKELDRATAVALIKQVADSGNPDACYEYACACYDREDFEESHDYLKRAANQGVATAFRGLYLIYSEGKVGPADSDLALEYLRKGVELEDPEAMGELGELHHQGKYVEQSDELAKRYLEDAAAKGSRRARMYHLIKMTDFPDYLAERFRQFGEAIQKTVFPEGRKIGVNDPCPCGSGKKYKKCCKLRRKRLT
jgi:TPR repeat protein